MTISDFNPAQAPVTDRRWLANRLKTLRDEVVAEIAALPVGSGVRRCVRAILAENFEELPAGTSATITISNADVPTNAVGNGCRFALNTAFDGPGLTSLKLSIGTPSSPTALLDSFEVSVGGGASAFGEKSVDLLAGGNSMGVLIAGPLIVTLESTGADVNTITVGEAPIVAHVVASEGL